jgi:guanylate kinase
MSNIFILFGPSGSGKSTYKKYFVSQGFYNIKSITTRRKRTLEDDEYIFVSKKEFLKEFNDRNSNLINANLNYRGDMYAVREQDIFKDGNGVMISDITSLDHLREQLLVIDDWSHFYFVYCEPSLDIEQRLIERNTPERIEVSREEIKYFNEILDDIRVDYRIKNKEDADEIIRRYKTNETIL